ncbi:CAP domain-containing protein, partial [Geomicrobium sediminis]|uniref:CAP domain-containing protein n=1 Tax=Geomicrobium sediminis TaxID=1347788 RepID=UPI0019562B88
EEAPEVDEPTEGNEEEAPEVDEPTEGNEEEAPEVDEPTEGNEEEAPEVDEPTEGNEEEAPEVDEPTEGNEEEAPEVDEPTEGNEEEAPEVDEPTEGNEEETPEVDEPEENEGSDQDQSVDQHAFVQEVIDLTNDERTSRGLSPLEADTQLNEVATVKSEDMRDNNYFSHDSPTYGSPFDMMNHYGVEYRGAGENIAAGQRSPEEVVNGWMNSQGHRENILNADYTHIGVGYAEGGSYGSYWTQMFNTK